MNAYQVCVLFLAISVVSASVIPFSDNDVSREKRGIFSGGIKGALLGGAAGAVLPGVSAGQGAKTGGLLGAGAGLLGHLGR